MSNLEEAKTALEMELDELGSYLYDLKGYIEQMESMISDAQQSVDDDPDAVRSEMDNIEMTAGDLYSDVMGIEGYTMRIVNAADEVENLMEEEKEEEAA